jgi:hypothetical protein
MSSNSLPLRTLELSGSARKSIDYSHFNVQMDDLLFSLLRIVRIKVRPVNTLRICVLFLSCKILFSLLHMVRMKAQNDNTFAFVYFLCPF